MKTFRNQIVKRLLLLTTGVIILFLSGCTCGKGLIKMQNAHYPISLSAFLYDKNHKVVMIGNELDSISSFTIKKTFWTLGYGLIPLTNDKLLCENVNGLIREQHGDGVINFSIMVEAGTINKIWSFLMYLPGYVPIIPASVKVTLSGTIVRLKS